MGVCASPPLSSIQSKARASSDYGKFSKVRNIDDMVEKLKKEEFNRVIDKLFAHYDKNADGNLDYDEIKKLLSDVLAKKTINDDDVEAILRLCKCENSKNIQK